MDTMPEGEGCSFEAMAIGLVVVLGVILLIPGMGWMEKIGLAFVLSVIMLAALANQIWNSPSS